MVVGTEATNIVGLVMLLPTIFALFVIQYLKDDRGKQAVLWFSAGAVAIAAWGILTGLRRLIIHPEATIILNILLMPVVTLSGVAWFLTVVEYVNQKTVSVRYGLYLMSPAVLAQALAWTNGSHYLIYKPSTTVNQHGILSIDPGMWFIVDQVLYPHALVWFAFGILFSEYLTTTSKARKTQIVLFMTGTVVLTVSATLWTFGLSPYDIDLFPFGAIVAGGIFIYTIQEYELFKVAPVGRRTAIEEIQDAIVIVNSDGKVADYNAAASRLFTGIQEGTPVGAVFPDSIDLDNLSEDNIEIETSIGRRYYSVNKADIDYGRDTQGKTVVCRDVTPVKERERELDLLKQVLSRIFRHNIRNKLVPIRGYAETIKRQENDEADQYAEKILESSTELLQQTEKARELERLTELEGIETVRLDDIMQQDSERLQDGEMDAIIETDIKEKSVKAHPKLDLAVTELITNSIEHYEGDKRPKVEIYSENSGDEITLYVEDNGPGLPETEIEVLREEEETDLRHGSGVGLWLVRWIAKKSDGDLITENTEEGARVGIRLPKANGHTN